MPVNNELDSVKLPMKQLWDERPRTIFKNNLQSIKVELISCPSLKSLYKYIPNFVNATWAESVNENYTHDEKTKAIYDVLHFNTLPTATETIGLTFKISGISLQEVTHILRHRSASFSAECSGDKWWSYKDALVPTSIENCSEDFGTSFLNRYIKLVADAKKLYCDMIDSKEISIMDARYILPRCLETFYYMRMNYKDAIAFIKQRIDRQIQPQTDNIMAYQMYYEILKALPLAYGVVNINEPSYYYIKHARTGKGTNLYFPEEHNDTFEYNENDFIYQAKREDVNGTDEFRVNVFGNLFRKYDREIHALEKKIAEEYKCILFGKE